MLKEPTLTYHEKIASAVQYIRNSISSPVHTGIILGTGLGKLLNDIEIIKEISYSDIPFFPISTVESHYGKLILGEVDGKTVLAMQGRFHYYEGYSMKEVTFPIRVMKMLGIHHLIVSNAAGGLNPDFQIGDVMIIEDHIDLFPENPLRGSNLEEFGVRFPDMSEPYDTQLIKTAIKAGRGKNIPINTGVYAGVQGPNLETKAEYRYLRTIGADAVGMSTIPEVIVAAHCGMKVFAVSAITDLCSPANIKKISIQEVLAAAAIAEPKMTAIIHEVIKRIEG
ncbi:purine-nucleoside phosphorylase [Negadavirga shengliensis]|uniref:Purine nucleoside phosphorylase n=1 Tax=Negadavirga shengliensis TaxID=1389218 RepID=A0ABV9T2M3_9BACT